MSYSTVLRYFRSRDYFDNDDKMAIFGWVSLLKANFNLILALSKAKS